MWDRQAIRFELLDDLSEDAVVTVQITTPVGHLLVMAEPDEQDRILHLRAVHVNGVGSGIGRNLLGHANLQVIAQAFMEGFDYDELVIEGALRTTGRRAGTRSGPRRFSRRGRDVAPE